MNKVYIDVIKCKVTIKDKKNRIVKSFENISTNNKDSVRLSIKFLMFAINKVFSKKGFNDEDYIFYINDKEIINFIKDTDSNTIYKKVLKDWHDNLDLNTISELGNFLVQFNKINSKDIEYFEEDIEYLLQEKKQELLNKLSMYDSQIQDELHIIRELSDKDVIEHAEIRILKLRELSIKRVLVKKELKKITKWELNKEGT